MQPTGWCWWWGFSPNDFYTFGENQTQYINANAHKPAVSTERPSVLRPKLGSNWVISTTEILKMKYVCSEYEQGELTILFKTNMFFFSFGSEFVHVRLRADCKVYNISHGNKDAVFFKRAYPV